MTDAIKGAPKLGAPTPALDLTAYTSVVIVKTDAVDGHDYRRGTQHTVDAATLKALQDKGMVAAAPAA